ncbi:MAG: hypothetical protein EAX91_04245 [Candidatus Lokiarchaeota archaeon]|nr:hypothetical protein [Candidatus Lokiarchaeota archaeon]
MLLQDALTQRIIIVLIVQVWPIFYGSILAYKILKRRKNRSTYTLATPFILNSITYFLATLSILFLNTPFAYILYITGIYFYAYCHCFFIILSWILVRLDDQAPFWKFILIVSFYGIISTYVFWIGFYFKGIRYDASTTWIPTYSLFFLLFSWSFLVIFILIPQIYFSFKLKKIFEGATLRRRINMYLVSFYLEFLVVFSVFLYNTWIDNQIYRIFYLVIMPATSTIAAFLVYKGFGKNL